MTFAVVTCPKCGLVQTIQILHKESTLNCTSCNKQTKLFKKDGRQVRIHGSFESASDAARGCAMLKEKEDSGFKSGLEK